MSSAWDDPGEVSFDHRLAELVAEDVHWMMVRMGLDVSTVVPNAPGLVADTRYTRMLRKAAEVKLAELEKEVGDGDRQ